MHIYVLISCIEQDVLGLRWSRRIIHRGMICRRLGYPIGVEVSHVKLIEWVSKRLEDKFMYGPIDYGLYGVLLSSFATMVEEIS